MENKPTSNLNSLYLVDENADHLKILNTISSCLNKAEALTITAANLDFDVLDNQTIGNYLWALKDIIKEAKWLYEKFINGE